MRQFAKRHDNRRLRQPGQLLLQILIALPDLFQQRLVLRWQTLYRIGNPAIPQLKCIMPGDRFRMITEAEVKQGAIQQDTGIIPGKRTATGVGSMHAGRQPDDQQARIAVSEGSHRSGMVVRMLA